MYDQRRRADARTGAGAAQLPVAGGAALVVLSPRRDHARRLQPGGNAGGSDGGAAALPAGSSLRRKQMAGSVNKVILVGNLGRDPEVRNTQDGTKIVHLSVATSETWKDRGSGERKERTEWHRVVIFNDRLGEIAERYLRKGSKVYLEGTLQTRKWAGQDGQERYTTEVVLGRFRGELTLLDGREGGGGGGGFGGGSGGYGGGDSYEPAAPRGGTGRTDPAGPLPDFDDEIPF